MLEKIFNGTYLSRLDNIVQWLERDRHNQESVSQHSYKVTIFARVLLEEIFGENNSEEVLKFKLDVVTFAMLHDWDEALILRDLSHDMKYNKFNGDEIREEVNKLSEHIANRDFNDGSDAGNMLVKNITDVDKDVKIFVKLCDWLALQFYIYREIQLGNRLFYETAAYCVDNIEKSLDACSMMLVNRFHFPINVSALSKVRQMFEHNT